jgi:threonine/homoserine/homoserine lactone efflux protein
LTLPLYSDTYLLMAVIDTTHALFVVEVLGILAIPGPTNSLLFVSGMSRGFRASLNLILAEVGAYLISISSLVLVLEPVTRTYSTVPQLLRVACSIYLVHLAIRLWRSGGQKIQDSHPITVRRVFFTTLMNPKNLIFAFGIFPIPSAGAGELLPYLAGFSVICTVVASGWIAAGALIQSNAAQRIHLGWVYRGEAFLLAGFAIVIFVSAYS